MAVDKSSERLLGEYTFNHSRTTRALMSNRG
jgi:hypothetical protein